jgi:hypothetical protein
MVLTVTSNAMGGFVSCLNVFRASSTETVRTRDARPARFPSKPFSVKSCKDAPTARDAPLSRRRRRLRRDFVVSAPSSSSSSRTTEALLGWQSSFSSPRRQGRRRKGIDISHRKARGIEGASIAQRFLCVESVVALVPTPPSLLLVLDARA